MCGFHSYYPDPIPPIVSSPEPRQIRMSPALAEPYGGDTIPAGRRMVATSEPWQVLKGAGRAEAVATHLRIANRELVGWWEVYSNAPAQFSSSRNTFQAGAAATQAMADLLDALRVGDTDAARAVIELFVNDAVDTGVVAL